MRRNVKSLKGLRKEQSRAQLEADGFDVVRHHQSTHELDALYQVALSRLATVRQHSSFTEHVACYRILQQSRERGALEGENKGEGGKGVGERLSAEQ